MRLPLLIALELISYFTCYCSKQSTKPEYNISADKDQWSAFVKLDKCLLNPYISALMNKHAMKLLNMSIRLLFLPVLLAISPLAVAAETAPPPFSIAFFYAANPPFDELRAFDIVVVDPDNAGISPKEYQTTHSKLFAYVSVGEADPKRQFFKKIDPVWLISDNSIWGTSVADLANFDPTGPLPLRLRFCRIPADQYRSRHGAAGSRPGPTGIRDLHAAVESCYFINFIKEEASYLWLCFKFCITSLGQAELEL